MKIYIKEDESKVDYKYLIIVAIEFKNGGELSFTLRDLARLFHMTYVEYIEHVAKNFNGLILDYGPHLLCTDEVFYENYDDAIRAKEWIESIFVLREIGK